MGERVDSFVAFWKTIRRYRLKKQFRKPFLGIGIIVLFLFITSIVYSPIANYYQRITSTKVYGKIKVDWYSDLNPVHLKYAQANGIKPFKKNSELKSEVNGLVSEGKLVKVKNTRNYQVERLTYSHPYLTPEAKNFLNNLGNRFRKKLTENNMGVYAYQISSLLRTVENQRALSKSNKNASPNSSHMYATTFDIAYDSVIKKPLPWVKVQMADPKAIKLLSEAIGELRSEGRCVVVSERQEKCFHITVVK